MAGEQAMDLATESPVSWSLGTALASSDSRIDKLAADGLRIGEVLKITTAQAVRLGTELKNSQDRASQSTKEWLAALGNVYGNLSKQIDAVSKLTGLYQKLGKSMQSARLPASGQAVSDPTGTVVGASNAFLGKAGKAVADSAAYQDIVNDIVIKGEPNVQARGEQRKAVDEKADAISKATGMGGAEAASLIREMLNSGLDLEQSLDLAPLAARFSVGQGVDAKDTAALFRSLVAGEVTKGKDVEGVLNQLIAQSKAGKVGISDVSQLMPRLMAAMITAGKKGAGNAVLVGQMVQEKGSSLGTTLQTGIDVEQAIEQRQFSRANAPTADADFVDADLKSRREGAGQIQKEMEASLTGLSRTVGDALQPITDLWMKSVTAVADGLGAVVEFAGPVATGLGAIALGATAAASAFGMFRSGMELFNAGKAMLGFQRDKPVVSAVNAGQTKPLRVIVINWPSVSDRGRPAKAGNPGKGTGPASPGRPKKGPPKRDARENPGRQRAQQSDTTRVDNQDRKPSASSGRVIAAQTHSFAGSPSVSFSPGGSGKFWSRAASTTARLGSFARFVPASKYLTGASMAWDTYRNANTAEDKAEGYGAAAGSMGGALIGGTVGAAIGQVLIPIPGVGAAIGGMVGASLASDAGGDLGGWFGRLWSGKGSGTTGSKIPAAKASVAESVVGEAGSQQAVSAEKTVVPERGKVIDSLAQEIPAGAAIPLGGVSGASSTAPSAVQQNITLSPSIPITVQGTITDPNDLVRLLTPAIVRMFADLTAQANGTQMYDGVVT